VRALKTEVLPAFGLPASATTSGLFRVSSPESAALAAREGDSRVLLIGQVISDK
jgi:hypothetical protein